MSANRIASNAEASSFGLLGYPLENPIDIRFVSRNITEFKRYESDGEEDNGKQTNL